MNETAQHPRIIFMGTPEFAVASLDALVKAGHQVVAVVTAPDKPAGRGMKLTSSAVKQYALEHHIPVLQPEKLKNPEFIETLRSYRADLQVVVAFRMLPEVVWNMPPMGTINVHASLLPAYRGAAPINWAVINGEAVTGVTTFLLTHEIDTGNILLRQELNISANETAGELHDRLKEAGAILLLNTITGMINGSIKPQPQEELVAAQKDAAAKHAPKIFTETCKIDWNKPVKQIHNLVRGLSPFPGAFTYLNGRMLKIFRSEIDDQQPVAPPGTVETDGKTYLRFAALNGYLQLKELQLEGKRKMPVAEFLRGFKNG